jgi:radical SAM protein with 4Fe4S-binding SPASM domain
MGIINSTPFLRNFFGASRQNATYATLEITTIFPCAVSCLICPQQKWKAAYKGKQLLTCDEFSLVLDKIPRNVRLDFSGFSEPFLNREASRMMRVAYRKGYEIVLYTTLTGFRREDLKELEEIKFTGCTIHIPDNLNFTVPDEEKWLESYRLFTDAIPYDNAIYHLGKLSPLLKGEIQRICRPPLLTRANSVDSGVIKPRPRRKGAISCSISGGLFHQNVMMPNGDVYLCCMDWSLQHKLGNLFQQSYEELHESAEYKRVCRAMSDPSMDSICRYCERSIRN